jgi:hypothetical protein
MEEGTGSKQSFLFQPYPVFDHVLKTGETVGQFFPPHESPEFYKIGLGYRGGKGGVAGKLLPIHTIGEDAGLDFPAQPGQHGKAAVVDISPVMPGAMLRHGRGNGLEEQAFGRTELAAVVYHEFVFVVLPVKIIDIVRLILYGKNPADTRGEAEGSPPEIQRVEGCPVDEGGKIKGLPIRRSGMARGKTDGERAAKFKLLGVPDYSGKTEEFIFSGIVVPVGMASDDIQESFLYAGLEFL